MIATQTTRHAELCMCFSDTYLRMNLSCSGNLVSPRYLSIHLFSEIDLSVFTSKGPPGTVSDSWTPQLPSEHVEQAGLLMQEGDSLYWVMMLHRCGASPSRWHFCRRLCHFFSSLMLMTTFHHWPCLHPFHLMVCFHWAWAPYLFSSPFLRLFIHVASLIAFSGEYHGRWARSLWRISCWWKPHIHDIIWSTQMLLAIPPLFFLVLFHHQSFLFPPSWDHFWQSTLSIITSPMLWVWTPAPPFPQLNITPCQVQIKWCSIARGGTPFNSNCHNCHHFYYMCTCHWVECRGSQRRIGTSRWSTTRSIKHQSVSAFSLIYSQLTLVYAILVTTTTHQIFWLWQNDSSTVPSFIVTCWVAVLHRPIKTIFCALYTTALQLHHVIPFSCSCPPVTLPLHPLYSMSLKDFAAWRKGQKEKEDRVGESLDTSVEASTVAIFGGLAQKTVLENSVRKLSCGSLPYLDFIHGWSTCRQK